MQDFIISRLNIYLLHGVSPVHTT